MKAKVVSIGNSKGIRLPKAILMQCHISDEVEMQIKGKSLIIKAPDFKARHGWEQSFKEMADNGEDALIMNDLLDIDKDVWTW
jgi:antitoxin MazE